MGAFSFFDVPHMVPVYERVPCGEFFDSPCGCLPSTVCQSIFFFFHILRYVHRSGLRKSVILPGRQEWTASSEDVMGNRIVFTRIRSGSSLGFTETNSGKFLTF